MPTLLHLDSSYDLDGSVTRALTRGFADAWVRRGADRAVVHRDLAADPVPHLAHGGLHWDPSPEQQVVIDQLLSAEVVVVGAPLYNYSLPSTLKAWLDHVHVPGTTAPFGGRDVQPLRGRTAVVVTARGTAHDGDSEAEGRDHATPVLRMLLGDALGMDVRVVTVDRTLSRTIEALAGERAAYEERYAAAAAELDALARYV